MDQAELWRRLAQRPNAVRFEEIDRLLRMSGFVRRHHEGSHYSYARGNQRITVPRRRPHILPVYVKAVLKLTEETSDDAN